MADAKTEEAAPKAGKGKLMILVILGVVLLLGGGGAAWFLMQGGDAEAKDGEHASKDHHGHDDDEEDEEDDEEDDDHGHGKKKKHSEEDEYEDEEGDAHGGGGGGGHGEEAAAVPGANYLALDPPFVVNFKTEPGKKPRARFLKIEVQCLTKTPGMLEKVKAHAPLVRNRLIMLFSGQNYDDLTSPDGIEALRVAALEEVRAAMKDVTGKKTVQDLFFTSFVMQ
jgi:flagellar protein FliL